MAITELHFKKSANCRTMWKCLVVSKKLWGKIAWEQNHWAFIINSPKVFLEHLIQKYEVFFSFQLLKKKNISISFPVGMWIDGYSLKVFLFWGHSHLDHTFSMEKVRLDFVRVHYKSIHYLFDVRQDWKGVIVLPGFLSLLISLKRMKHVATSTYLGVDWKDTFNEFT